jgi:polyhydroxyalkanoate synthesis regulator phasin
MNSSSAIRKGMIPVVGPQAYMMQPYSDEYGDLDSEDYGDFGIALARRRRWLIRLRKGKLTQKEAKRWLPKLSRRISRLSKRKGKASERAKKKVAILKGIRKKVKAIAQGKQGDLSGLGIYPGAYAGLSHSMEYAGMDEYDLMEMGIYPGAYAGTDDLGFIFLRRRLWARKLKRGELTQEDAKKWLPKLDRRIARLSKRKNKVAAKALARKKALRAKVAAIANPKAESDDLDGIIGDYWTGYTDWWKQQNAVVKVAAPAAFLFAVYQIPAVKRRVKKAMKKKGR